jgi:hypothetical protein
VWEGVSTLPMVCVCEGGVEFTSTYGACVCVEGGGGVDSTWIFRSLFEFRIL